MRSESNSSVAVQDADPMEPRHPSTDLSTVDERIDSKAGFRPGDKVTVISGAPLRRTGSPLIDRIRSQGTWLATIALLAVVGAGALCLNISKSYQASTQIALTVPDKAISGPTLLHLTIQKLGVSTDEAKSVTLSYAREQAPNIFQISATADSPDVADKTASIAADIAVAEDNRQWAREIAEPGAPAPLFGQKLAYIVGPNAASPGSSDAPQYLLHWNSNRLGLAGAWIALFGLLAIGSLMLGPTVIAGPIGRTLRGTRPLRAQQSSVTVTADLDYLGIEITNIPVLAGVLLTPDLVSPIPGACRPILMDVDTRLWSTIAETVGGGDLSGLPPHAREILFTRALDEDRGSWAAVLAIGRTLAQRGVSTMIVDADLTASESQRGELGLPHDVPGLAEILNGAATVEDCLLEDDEYLGLSAIPAGQNVCDQIETQRLLSSTKMLNLLDMIGSEHACLLIHGPSAGIAAVLGARAGKAILVCNEHAVGADSPADQWALAVLDQAHADVVGRIEVFEAEPDAALGVHGK